MAKIQPWEAEVDEGSATPTPVKKPMPKPAPKPAPKPKTVPIGQAEVDDGSAMKKGGKVKKYARGGGIELRGKTKGRMC